MRLSLLSYWDHLRASFWFVPMVMAVGALISGYATVALDKAVTDRWLRAQSWAYTGSAEGASTVLGTIAGSMITIAGVVFSMTLVALSLASSQLGPRLLRNFMTDRTNQVVLGTFVATFLYCLVVLRSIRRAGDDVFVPHLSVTLGVLFAVASLAVLIYFIHHVSVSIQADVIVARVGAELMQGLDRLFPEAIGRGQNGGAALPDAFAREACAVRATEDGYLQLVDGDALMALATTADLVLRLERRPGHFVVRGSPLALVWPGDRVDDQINAQVNAAFVLASQRTPVQDVEFTVNQLVEIAVRALSPGVNDPFTAIACIDRLGAALSRLAQREMPSACRHDEQNKLRVIAPVTTFATIADAAFDLVRQHARSSAAVTVRLLETITVVAGFASQPEDRAALRRHAEMVARGREGLPEEEDRRTVEACFLIALRALEETEAAHQRAP